jgi:uncharacterized protein (DUF302 family)
MTTSTFTTTHVRVCSEKRFGEVTGDFERQLGKFDPTDLQSLAADAERAVDARARIQGMAGSSGFMLFGTTDHGSLLTLVGGQRKAVQYLLGNPLIAIEMTRHNLSAGLYAPLRVLVYQDDGRRTCLEYDQPSSLFGQFNDDRIASVAELLDRKLEDLIARAVG